MGYRISNGTILDGTGKSGFIGDVFIENGKISYIIPEGEPLPKSISKEFSEINAFGLIVSPGWIDIHHHGDLNLLEMNTAEPTLLQGVTTLGVGVCGLGTYPSNSKVEKYYGKYISKAFGTEGQLFKDFNSWKAKVLPLGIGVNIASFLAHGNLRAFVMGMDARKPTPPEMEEMKQLIRDSMDQGAFGLSSGLVYPPGSNASTEELIELCKVVAEYDGLYCSHTRNEGAAIMTEGLGELVEIGRSSGVRIHNSHLSVISKQIESTTVEILNYIKRLRDLENLPITADVTLYPHGATSLSFVLLDLWVYEDFIGNLSNVESRKRIVDEIFEKLYAIFFADAPWYLKILPKFLLKKIIFRELAKIVFIISTEKQKSVEGKSLIDAFAILYPNESITEALLSFLRDEEGKIMIRIARKDEVHGMIPVFKQTYVCPSTDGFLISDRNTHPNSFGGFARVLERWVREMKIISLEEAIRKMTSLPASILGLQDRGKIKEGMMADVTIFDYNSIHDNATYLDGRKSPDGIIYVFVNGELAVERGKYTGQTAGKFLNHKKKN